MTTLYKGVTGEGRYLAFLDNELPKMIDMEVMSIISCDLWVQILGKFSYYICASPVFDSKEIVLSCVHIMMFCCLLNFGGVHYITMYKCNCCRGGRRPRED